MRALVLLIWLLAAPPGAPQETAASELQTVLETIRARHDLPGLAGAILAGDRLVAVGAAGVRERGSEAAFTAGDKVHLGSCTKSMTATVAAMLVEEGKLEWDSSLASIFPERAESMHADWRPVTLAQLLSHRAGAPANLLGPNLLGHGPLGLEVAAHGGPPRATRLRVLEGVAAAAPVHAPGSRYLYSNVGYVMAAAMMEEVTDTDCEELLATRLFEPLGMSSAGFGPPSSEGELDQPRGHWKSGAPSGRFDNPPFLGPAGRAHATLADWGKYLALHLAAARGEAGDEGLIGQGSFNALHAVPAGAEEPYSLGWAVTERPWAEGLVLTHAGSNTAWYCVTWMGPEKNFAVLAATNQGGPAAAQACDEVSSALIGLHLRRAGETRR